MNTGRVPTVSPPVGETNCRGVTNSTGATLNSAGADQGPIASAPNSISDKVARTRHAHTAPGPRRERIWYVTLASEEAVPWPDSDMEPPDGVVQETSNSCPNVIGTSPFALNARRSGRLSVISAVGASGVGPVATFSRASSSLGGRTGVGATGDGTSSPQPCIRSSVPRTVAAARHLSRSFVIFCLPTVWLWRPIDACASTPRGSPNAEGPDRADKSGSFDLP